MSEPTLVIARWPRLNKQNRLSEYVAQLDRARDYTTEKVRVVESIELSTELWADFTGDLLKDRAWLKGKGGCDSSATGAWREQPVRTWTPDQIEEFRAGSFRLAIEVIGPADRFLYVDPQGCGYARYVGFPIGQSAPARVGTLAVEGRPQTKAALDAPESEDEEPLEDAAPAPAADNDQAASCPECGRRIPAGSTAPHPRPGSKVQCEVKVTPPEPAPVLEQPVAEPTPAAAPVVLIPFNPDNPEHVADELEVVDSLEPAAAPPPAPAKQVCPVCRADGTGCGVCNGSGIRPDDYQEPKHESPAPVEEKKPGVAHILALFSEQSTTDDW